MRASLALLALFIATCLAASLYASSKVVVVSVEGVITQGTYEELSQALNYASSLACPLIVLINTPGGSLDATKAMVQAMLNSKVPVVAYVYPKGATAWSAGSMILLASHVAAMAPGTVVGSAQPVAYSPLTGAEPVEEGKIVNAVAEYMEQVAAARGRNSTAARLFVTENLNLGSVEALKAGVIDLVAEDLNTLLSELHGAQINLDGSTYIFDTKDAEVEWFEGGLRSKAVSILSDPTLASVLFMAGLMGLVFGLAYAQPVPATVGGFMVLLSLLGLGMDVNVVSILLLAVGTTLLAVELFVTPGFGVLGVSGMVMLILGALLSPFTASPERWSVHPEWLGKLSLITYAAAAPLIGFAIFALYKVVKARRLKPMLHLASLVGRVAVAVDELGPSKKGFVICEGEYWEAVSKVEVSPGERVKVIGKEGPTLIVDKPSEEGGGGA